MNRAANLQGYSAIFADLENIYFYLKNNDAPNPELLTTELIRRTRDHIIARYQEPCILMIGYADFDQVDLALSDFYLMGMEPRTVVNTEHKNSADMRLCIDALETLYTRPEIQTFVLMAGDRDYIPLVQHLQRQARKVLIVAFRGNLSGDLLHIVGEANFINAEELLGYRVQKSPSVPTSLAVGEVRSFITPRPLAEEEADLRRCLDILVNEFANRFSEIGLVPFLRRLNEVFPHLANHERKELLRRLEESGAIRIEQREGQPYPYSVALVNWNHPTVREVNRGE